jgi:radical SAM superfamily enzyme YgiQ (UPF0313 family)
MKPAARSRRSFDRRTILAREVTIERFPRPANAAVRVAAGYAAPYRVAMSNLGYHFLYAGLRRSPGLRVERFFADTSPATLESGSPLSEKTALLFSISYEEDYLNVVRMLHESGVPPLRAERRGGPLVIAGGPAVSANPFPLADIVDAATLGEGEGMLEAIVSVLEDASGVERDALRERLARIPGVLVPGLSPAGVSLREGSRLESFPRSVILTPETVFPATLLVECARGCPGACAFCLATSIYRPYRAMPFEALRELIDSFAVPIRRVGLVSTALAAHPDFERIVRFLRSKEISVAFSSLRAEDLDDDKAALVGAIGTSSVSLAPESGSEIARSRLGKKVPDEVYFQAARKLHEAGVRRFTLYLLIGWPSNDDAMISNTVTFIEHFKQNINRARLDVHVNPIIPKAWTPFQFLAMPEEQELSAAQRGLEKALGRAGANVSVKSVRSALRQALFSTGDERIGRAIVLHVVDGLSWKKALREAQVNERFPHEEKGPETSFPWDAIEGPVRRGALFKRFEAMTRG